MSCPTGGRRSTLPSPAPAIAPPCQRRCPRARTLTDALGRHQPLPARPPQTCNGAGPPSQLHGALPGALPGGIRNALPHDDTKEIDMTKTSAPSIINGTLRRIAEVKAKGEEQKKKARAAGVSPSGDTCGGPKPAENRLVYPKTSGIARTGDTHPWRHPLASGKHGAHLWQQKAKSFPRTSARRTTSRGQARTAPNTTIAQSS